VAFERVKRTRRGDFLIRIPSTERALLRRLPEELRAVLGAEPAGDAALRRLFPPATMDDPTINAEFERLTHDDLLAEKLAAAEVMERTIDAERLSEDELVAWLSVLNDLRLVLGVRIDVTEETTAADYASDDLRTESYSLYLYLTFLEDQVISALAG
jgi:hypothetical protein